MYHSKDHNKYTHLFDFQRSKFYHKTHTTKRMAQTIKHC